MHHQHYYKGTKRNNFAVIQAEGPSHHLEVMTGMHRRTADLTFGSLQKQYGACSAAWMTVTSSAYPQVTLLLLLSRALISYEVLASIQLPESQINLYKLQRCMFEVFCLPGVLLFHLWSLLSHQLEQHEQLLMLDCLRAEHRWDHHYQIISYFSRFKVMCFCKMTPGVLFHN